MRLCAVYSIWNDWDLLSVSIDNIFQVVDGVIVVYSRKSNYGELSDPADDLYFPGNVELFQREPMYAHPSHSETDKRNYGLNIAREQGYTHFVMMDADEFYEPRSFWESRIHVERFDIAGLVCRTKVYVKSPTLTIGYDTTLVPFIHKITPGLKHEFNKSYPFAWEDKNLRIDPTRSLNINSGVEWSDITMHHYSWVRKDIEKKIRNSTARANLQKMNLANKFVHLKEGDIFDLYPNKPLVREQARFNVPDYGVVQDLQPSTGSGTDSKPV